MGRTGENQKKGLSRASFRLQLAAAFVVGILLLAVIAPTVTAVRSGSAVEDTLVRNALRLTESFADQSRLSLLYRSPENAEEAARSTLSHPDVESVTVALPDGRTLLNVGGRASAPVGQRIAGEGPVLLQDADHHWIFGAPVYSLAPDELHSPFDIRPPERELLGYVYLRVGKGTLETLASQILATNVTITVGAAGLLLLILLAITERVTKPIKTLSAIMGRAARGEKRLRAEPLGPSDIRHMEESFNHMMTQLESRESELEQARDTALQSARLKGEFAANVTHELRTPLSSMLGLMELVASDAGLNPRLKEYIEVARSSGDTLMSLINDVLDFSKLDAGRLKPRPVDFQPEAMLDELVGIFGAQAGRKGIELGYVVEQGVPLVVRGEEGRLRQVLVNLVGNAIKFTDEGGVRIRLAVQERGEGSVLLRYEVEDTGVGIEPEALGRIFDAFSQADGALNRSYGGTGLGLTISRQLVLYLGGDISVTSQPGRGSVFSFTAVFKQAESGAVGPALDYDRLAGLRALIVDTSRMSCEFVATFFRKWGIFHRCCQDPDEAMEILRGAARSNRPFDLVLADYMLPRVGGNGLAGQIAEDAGLRSTRVLLMTAARLAPRPEHAEAGVAGTVEKPIREERLYEVIEGVLAPEVPPETAPAPPEPPAAERQARDLAELQVLVVEDHLGNRLVAGGMLESLGCRPRLVPGAEDALALVGEQSFDLVLMDCQMPGMDGYAATRGIREREAGSGRRVPIVAMTAHSRDQVWEECRAAGMDEFLRKPLTLHQLRAVIEHWTRREGAPAPALPGSRQPPPRSRGDSPVDAKVVAALCRELGDGACASVMESFVAEMPIYARVLRQAMEMGEYTTVYEQAHKIKGAAGNFGAYRLDELCNRVEVDARAQDVEALEQAIAQLEREGERVVDALRVHSAERSGGPVAVAQRGRGLSALIADDDRPTRLAIAALLESEGYTVLDAVNGEAAIDICAREMPDIVILDAVMPKINGFEVCAFIRQQPRGADVPVLITTALDDSVAIRRAFDAGASDYLAKPIDFAAMRGRIARLVDARDAQQRVEELAFHDTLTDLPNRTHFTDRMAQAVSAAEGSELKVAVLILDLDRFKHINEKVGHDVGDLLLRAVASRLKNIVRKGDVVARFGGDEYAMLLNRVEDVEAVVATAEKIVEAMSTPFSLHNREYAITTAIGLAMFPDHGAQVADLIGHAETAMYCAKERGRRGTSLDSRSQYCVYQPGLELAASQEIELEQDLRRAIKQGEIVVYYQPKLDLKTDRVVGMEALCRWSHPERGIVMPEEFIRVAENSGLIHDLGETVLRQSCRQLQEWSRKGFSRLQVSVNLSGIQFEREDLVERIATVINETGLPAEQLALEITESVLVDNTETVPLAVEEMRRMGISISIDDFGTGYSSLLHLKRLPYDTLKIDREFVKDVTTNESDASMVRAIIAMAASLDLTVVAEGVETEEQREYLRDLGCDQIQGFLVSKPLSAAVFETTMLRAKRRAGARSGDGVVTRLRQPGQEG